jgi:hypothetical protein
MGTRQYNLGGRGQWLKQKKQARKNLRNSFIGVRVVSRTTLPQGKLLTGV